MLIPATIPGDLMTVLAVLFLLFGVPAILFGLIMLYTGYVRYDAEQYLEELEAQAATEPEHADEVGHEDTARNDVGDDDGDETATGRPDTTDRDADPGRSPEPEDR